MSEGWARPRTQAEASVQGRDCTLGGAEGSDQEGQGARQEWTHPHSHLPTSPGFTRLAAAAGSHTEALAVAVEVPASACCQATPFCTTPLQEAFQVSV